MKQIQSFFKRDEVVDMKTPKNFAIGIFSALLVSIAILQVSSVFASSPAAQDIDGNTWEVINSMTMALICILVSMLLWRFTGFVQGVKDFSRWARISRVQCVNTKQYLVERVCWDGRLEYVKYDGGCSSFIRGRVYEIPDDVVFYYSLNDKEWRELGGDNHWKIGNPRICFSIVQAETLLTPKEGQDPGKYSLKDAACDFLCLDDEEYVLPPETSGLEDHLTRPRRAWELSCAIAEKFNQEGVGGVQLARIGIEIAAQR